MPTSFPVACDRPLPLTPAAACLLIGNLLDALVTLTLLELQLAYEANPLLDCAYQVSPLAFVVGKLSMVQLAVLIVARPGVEWALAVVARSGAAVYGGVLAYQASLVARLL